MDKKPQFLIEMLEQQKGGRSTFLDYLLERTEFA